MLKRMYKKKLLICSIVIFSIFLVCLFPHKKDNITIKEELSYNEDITTSTIFLLDSKNYVAATKIITKEKNIEKKAKELLESLIIDSDKQDNIPSGFKEIIPSGTKILSLIYNNGVIKVNFSKELLNTKENMEEAIIEAIIYTLTSINDVKHIIIYVEDELLTKLPKSKINLPSTLDRSFGINKEYNINKLDNINKTTVYYINTFDNKTYYVPVTKINNDSRNKIEIIIDELSSNNTYKTNLMSYLNSNTKLISVEEKENELRLSFNNSILDNISNQKILEEVIYTISLSVKDNYNVDSVVFNVDNKEIYKSVLKTLE